MSGDNTIDRRKLLKSIAASGALAKWPALAAAAPFAEVASEKAFRFFTPPQVALMESLVDQLIPADDFAGARDTGVVHCIDEKLAGSFGSFFAGRYQAGLEQMDQLSRQHFGQDFASLDGNRQSDMLHGIADNNYGAGIHDFFVMALSDTFEGYYGNPADGGNRDGASWKMIGFGG